MRSSLRPCIIVIYRLSVISDTTGDQASEWRCFFHGAVSKMRVAGRLNGFIQLPDGSVIHGQGLFHCIRNVKSIKGAQLIAKNGLFSADVGYVSVDFSRY